MPKTYRPIIIEDNYGPVKELVVFDCCPAQYAIKRSKGVFLMISREKFQRIINTARENGFSVFDYTDFD